ncbi:HNH nuclease domain-containing protein [Aeromonas phage ZPAH1]|nr:HNH nuclease domain-containing protein [Aeromonas phage ZPAH1]
MRTCTRCKLSKPLSEFYKRSGLRSSEYYTCCKICHSAANSIKFNGFKDKCLEYKGYSCSKCGYSKCKAALEFHHVDPRHKDFQISRRFTMKWENVMKELDKCIVVCANCHREIHEVLDV